MDCPNPGPLSEPLLVGWVDRQVVEEPASLIQVFKRPDERLLLQTVFHTRLPVLSANITTGGNKSGTTP